MEKSQLKLIALQHILCVAHLGNPNYFKELKGYNIKKRIKKIKVLLKENDIDYKSLLLNGNKFKTFREDMKLKKEIKDIINNNDNTHEKIIKNECGKYTQNDSDYIPSQ